MHGNESHSQQLNVEIQEWRDKALNVQKSINDDEIKNILESILSENSDEGNNFIKNASNILQSATINDIHENDCKFN
jgi:hypothetical protein